MLADIMGSRIRAELFRLLFTRPETELHGRELQRRSGFNDRALRQELAKLTRLELVMPRRAGNRLYYRANTRHPLYPDLRNLALKTAGWADALKACLASENIQIAFVFGSLARHEEQAQSDVDLMVIGDAGLRALTGMLKGAAETLGREINPHILTREDYRKRLAANDHFLRSILTEPKIFIKGDEDELIRLGA